MRNKRTIFWTLMTGDKEQKETHKSNWVWYVDGTETKVEWKKAGDSMWKGVRVPAFKKGVYSTISVGELVKAFGTPDDKKQWCKTLGDIGALSFKVSLETAGTGLEPSQTHNTTASSEEKN